MHFNKIFVSFLAGALVGNVISMAVTGIIIERLSWPYVFYIYGFIGILWYVTWIMFVSDTPSTHRFISEEEKKYLEETVTDITDERKVSKYETIGH